MTTIKQEIKALKVGQEKIFKVDYESEYLTIRKSKAKGLEIILSCNGKDYELLHDDILNNFKSFSLYDESEIDY
jgi:hypothetical protein